MINIRLASDSDQTRWDDFVISHEDAGPYHLFAWKESVEKAYGHKAYYLMAENDKEIIQGILPLILIKPPFMKGTLVSQPFCDYGGVLTEDIYVSEIMFQKALQLAESLKAGLEVRCKNHNPDLESYGVLRVESYKSRMLLELPESSEVLWEGFKSKLRSQIRKPKKEGLKFFMGKTDELDEFYGVFKQNMHSLGSPVHSRRWIESVLNSYSNHAHIGIVYFGNKPIAAGFILCFRDTVSIPWASTLREYNHLSPNMLLYWGFLEYACNNKFKWFDFGRSTPSEGTFKFKEQWGAKPSPLYWYIEGLKDQDRPISSTGKSRKLVENAWSRLPLSIANMAGPIIRKYITL